MMTRLLWAGLFALAFVGLSVGVHGQAPPGDSSRIELHPRSTAAAIPVADTLHITEPSPAVYPDQVLPLRFDHGRHLARGMACIECHVAAPTSTQVADNLLPRGVACDRCHTAIHADSQRGDPSTCISCHTVIAVDGRTQRPRLPTARLRFSHAVHDARGVACETCHRDMSTVGLATVDQLPTEAMCLTCHDGRQATSRCGACHPTDASGRLVTQDPVDYRGPRLVPRDASAWGAAHDLTFVQDHAGIARANPQLCETCHDPADCRDCHNGDVRPLRIHQADYLTTHALDARARTQECQACHRMQSDCRACHERLRVVSGPRGNFGVGSPLRFHPEGWAGPPGQLASQGHAREAQRNMAACASCHDEQSCMWCHATATGPMPGLSANPHGPGFADSLRCQALAQRNHRACLKCHAPGDADLRCRG